jgi:GTP-binding protein HflX
VFDEVEEAAVAASVATKSADAPRNTNRVFLVGLSVKEQPQARGATLSIEDSLDELAQLAETAGLEVAGRLHQNVVAPDRRTYIGSGKLQELLEQARSLDVDTVIFDSELRPSQARNIERQAAENGGTPVRVCDRVELILDIFRQRAATREGFLQTQLARVQYQLPRLTRLWSHLERQSGGGGLAAKGMGESQLEIDKRLLRVQAARIREKLESVRTHRAVHRLRRAAAPLPVIALCGYTSAGKSTLTNLLTDAEIYADAKLFSTLDPTTRRTLMPSGQAVLITDTVGFIQARACMGRRSYSLLTTCVCSACVSTRAETAHAARGAFARGATRPRVACTHMPHSGVSLHHRRRSGPRWRRFRRRRSCCTLWMRRASTSRPTLLPSRASWRS